MSDNPNSRQGSSSSFGSGGGRYQQPALFEPGSLICFTYQVEALLARGGMGEVYKTRHTEIGTEHAIKMVRPDLANSEKIMELFRREASVLRTVRDDAIVGYDGVLRDEEGRVYLVMEFVDGPSLTAFLQDRVLSLDEVRRLRDRLARGLAAAHAKGVIHRDMSPDNIILGHGDLGQAKIIDFGIAKLSDSSATTIIGDDFAGRYAYASPEQIGLYGGQVDARSDIYSLGLVLATAATGKALNMGEISESLVSVIEARKRIPDFSSVPPELRPELGSMLEPDPKDRPQSMLEVVGLDQRLREAEAAKAREAAAPAAAPAAVPPARAAEPLAAEPAARPQAEGQAGQRRWLMPALAASVAVIAAGGVVAWQQFGGPGETAVAESAAPADPVPAAEASNEVASNEVAPASGPAAAPAGEATAVAEAKAAEEARLAAEAKAAEEARLAAEAEARAAEEARVAAEAKAAEEARLAAEAEAKAAEEARLAAEAKAAEEARQAAEAKAAEEARLAAEAKAAEEARQAAEAQAAEEARLAAEAEAKAAEEAKLAAEAKAAEEARLAAEAQAAEEARAAAEAKAAEEARLAAEAQAVEEARVAAEAKAAAEAEAAQQVTIAAAAAPQEEQVAAVPPASAADLQLAMLRAAEADLTADQRRDIQRDLRALGHYAGGIDGDFGPGTRRAIEAYQKVAGLEPTGYLLPDARQTLAEQAAPARAEAERQAAADRATADRAAAEAAAARAQAAAQARQPAQGTTLQAALPNESEVDRLIRLAEGGDVLAQASLGQRYYRGDGVRRDFTEAVRWTRRAAEQGEARAQANLGLFYMKGEGVSRSPAEAARWWREAAGQGVTQAQFNLGMLYEHGDGVQVDYREAAKWYDLAAAQGDRNAADRLAGLKRRNLVPATN